MTYCDWQAASKLFSGCEQRGGWGQGDSREVFSSSPQCFRYTGLFCVLRRCTGSGGLAARRNESVRDGSGCFSCSAMAEVPGAALSPLENGGGMAVGRTPGTGTAEEVSSSACEEGDTEPVPGSPRTAGRAEEEEAGTISLLKIEEKFFSGQYRAIDQFVTDFRSMLEGCYRLYGADHWLSKQAQKLELVLEQKLALLPR